MALLAFEKLSDVTPTKITAFRKSRGMTKKFFWNSIFISQSKATRIENGFTPISDETKLLIFLYYSDLPNPKIFVHAELLQAAG